MTTRRRSPGRPPGRTARRPGRPREEATDEAITEAAITVLAERGLAALSMEAVARRAGVAKSTLYRRFPSRLELALHAVGTTFESITLEDSGSLDTDLRAGIGEAVRLLSDPATGSAYAALLAEGARDPDGVGARVRESLSARLQALVAGTVERSIARGEIRPEMVDVPLLADVIVGAVLHRAMVTGAPDEQFVDSLIELLTDVAFARFVRMTQGLDD